MSIGEETGCKEYIAMGHCPRYRDELNFAEFPLAALTDHVPESIKTLVFRDTIFDQGNRTPVTRTLTIAASDKYGLPTPLDEEVILGLIQLTSEQRFANRKVYFTRYELIRLLGWGEKGQSYRRIDESLRRWMGVTLYYEKAWWSREDQSWVTEQFHLLEQVSILDRERRERRRSVSEPGDSHAGKSFFVWNEVVWANFQAGHLKKLDFDLFKALSTPIAKRMYRFLDKHFYHRDTLEYSLKDFACEHIGLSRGYHTGEIKRRLQSALTELETRGYLQALPSEKRFVKSAPGEWKIVLIRARHTTSASRGILNREQEQSYKALKERGVGEKKATYLAKHFTPIQIAEKLSLHDWLKQKESGRIKHPAGFLVKSIEEGYDLKGFPDFLQNQPRKEPEKPKTVEPAHSIAITKQEANSREEEALDAYLQTLNTTEKEVFETTAVGHSDAFLATQYQERREKGGSLFQAVRRSILLRYWKNRQQLIESCPTSV